MIPIYTMNRLFSVLYPWIIVLYLSAHNNGIWSEMVMDSGHYFEIILLFIYIALQFVLLILGVFVFRTHYWLWHVAPGRNDIRWPFKLKPTMTKLYQYYDALQWKPMVDDILMKHGFG